MAFLPQVLAVGTRRDERRPQLSFVYHRPIRQLVAERVWNTVLLNGLALAAWIFGVALGLARRRVELVH